MASEWRRARDLNRYSHGVVPIPPPPLPKSEAESGHTDSDQPPMSYGIPELHRARVNARPGQLTRGWQTIAVIGWAVVVYGISAAGQGGDQLGKRPWWLHGFLVPIPFLLPLAAGIAAIINWRWSTVVGLLAVASTSVVAFADRTASPGVAAVEGVIALVGLLTTLAASAGRVPGRIVAIDRPEAAR